MTSGNNAVDAIGQMNFTGNVIPITWCKKICFENGKPNLNAILILSDIVYWYRPREIRDENSGALIGYEKKFKADLLQRSYQSFSEQFGISKRQAKDAIDLLADMEIIYREFRNVDTKSGMLFNVMFIGVNPDRLSEITFDHEGDEENAESRADTNQRRRSYVSLQEGGATECREVVHSNVTSPTIDVGTNTEITTENTTRDYYNPINQSSDGLFYVHGPSGSRDEAPKEIDEIDEINDYREVIRENIRYDYLMASHSDEADRRRIDEIYEIICDVVSSKKDTIRVGGEDKPLEVVKSVFLKLTDDHITYVTECLDKTCSDIGNIRSYLITALYRSIQTAENFLNQKVNHGQHEYVMNNRKQEEI